MTLEEGINWYVRRKQATGLSFSKGYYTYRAFLSTVGNLSLSQINVNHVSQFLNRSQASATVFRTKYSLLQHFFDYWTAHGEIAEPPMPANRPRQRSNFLPYIYAREELRRLLRVVPSSKTSNDKIHPKTLSAAFLMLYATGASVGEVTTLVNEDVDLQNGLIKFSGNLLKSSRCIPIGRDLVRVLRQYVEWRERIEVQSQFFFCRINGSEITPRAFRAYFERLRRSAGIAGYWESSQRPCVRDLRRISPWPSLLRQSEPASLPSTLQATPRGVFSNKGHVRVRSICRPVVMEVLQEALPIAGEPVLLKVGEGEREGMVDADELGDVPVEFFTEPLGETQRSPVPTRTGQWQNLCRLVGTLGHEHTEPLATGFRSLSAGVVDADVSD